AISTNGRLRLRRAAYRASKNWRAVPVKVRFAAWVAARSTVESCRDHPIAAMRSMPAAASAVAGPSRGGGQIRRGGSCGSECAVGVEAFTGHHSPQSGRYSPLARLGRANGGAKEFLKGLAAAESIEHAGGSTGKSFWQIRKR